MAERPELGTWFTVQSLAYRHKTTLELQKYGDSNFAAKKQVTWDRGQLLRVPIRAMYIGFRFVQEGELQISWNGTDAWLVESRRVELWEFVKNARELPFKAFPDCVVLDESD